MLYRFLFFLITIFSFFTSKAQYRNLPQSPEVGFNLPSIIEKTADIRLNFYPNYPIGFNAGFGYMFNNNLNGNFFRKVEDGTSNWNNSGFFIVIGGRANVVQYRQPTDFYFMVNYLGGYFSQSCNATNTITNSTYKKIATGLFHCYTFEGGIKFKVDESFSLEFGVQLAVPFSQTAYMASQTFSVLPGVGPIAVGSIPRLLIILSPKFSF